MLCQAQHVQRIMPVFGICAAGYAQVMHVTNLLKRADILLGSHSKTIYCVYYTAPCMYACMQEATELLCLWPHIAACLSRADARMGPLNIINLGSCNAVHAITLQPAASMHCKWTMRP
jgi:hypothetical protein